MWSDKEGGTEILSEVYLCDLDGFDMSVQIRPLVAGVLLHLCE